MAGVCPSYSYKSLVKLPAVTVRKYSKYYQQKEEVLKVTGSVQPMHKGFYKLRSEYCASCYVTCSLSTTVWFNG